MDDNSRCSTRCTAGEISPENNDINDTSSMTEERQVLNNSGRHVHFEKNSEENVTGSGVKKGDVTENVIQNKGNTVRNEQRLKQKDIVQNYRETTETYLTELPQTSLEHRAEKDCSRSKETTLQSSQNTASLGEKENLQNSIEKKIRSSPSKQDILSETPVEKKVNTSSSLKQESLKQESDNTPFTQLTEDEQEFGEDDVSVNQR